LMEGQLKTSEPQTLDLFDAPISSPEQVSGKSPADLPSGPLTDTYGRRRVRASRSLPLAKGSEPMTQGTCGRTYFASSTPAGPLASWESRLRERLAMLGSTESALIWKASATPSGRSKSRLVQSTVHKNGPGIGGSQWPTPGASLAGDTPETHEARQSRVIKNHGRRMGTPLAIHMIHAAEGTKIEALVSQWPAPTVADVEGGRKTRSGARSDEMLLNGLMAQWAVPTARDWRSDRSKMTSEELYGTKGRPLARQILEASGAIATGSIAQTEKRGAPNPIFACWLMGWPDELTSGALQAIQSFRGSRRKSSRRSLKADA
jgi:hypothetical protein